MELTDWLIQTNQILQNAAQNLPAEYVNQLRIFQQTLMVNRLQSGFLAPSSQNPFDSIASNNPFANLGFSKAVAPTQQPFQALQNEWQQSVSRESNEPSTPKVWDAKPKAPPLKDWSVLGR